MSDASAALEAGRGDRIDLIGLDVGTTTVRGLRVSARRTASATTGCPELSDPRVTSRLPAQLTPFVGEDLDVPRLVAVVTGWLGDGAGADGGGVLLTGLAARAPSAARAAEALRERAGNGVVLTAADPRLESWVAFMARAHALSRAWPGRLVVNLDVGGGTTNVAWGRDGAVVRTASLYVGARHVRLEPGGRRVAALSREARALCAADELSIRQGEELAPEAASAFVARQVEALEELVLTGQAAATLASRPWLVQSAPEGAPLPEPAERPLVTLSGGVGELVRTGATGFDDLGPELARALAASPVLASADPGSEDAGLATVWGLTLHATTLSGATIFVPQPQLLPRRDLPIVAHVSARADRAAWDAALGLARLAPGGGAVVVPDLTEELELVRALGGRLADALAGWPPDRLLVVLIRANVGLALGQYATAWGRRPAPLVVLDQVALRDARLITLGRPVGGQIPVAFSGICEVGGTRMG